MEDKKDNSNALTPPIEFSNPKIAEIFAGAKQEFLDNGFSGTTIEKIAAASGVSKATIYNHFKDKETLYIELIKQMMGNKNWSEFNIDDALEMEANPRKVLKLMAKAMLETSSKDEQMLVFMRTVIAESGRFPELAKTFVRCVEKPMHDLFISYISRCPQLKYDDPAPLAWMFSGTLVYYMMVHKVLQGRDIMPIEQERLIDMLVERVLCGQAI